MSRIAELHNFPAVEQAVKGSPLVLLDMWGTYCAPCRALRPILEELAGSKPDWSFVAVNIENVPEVADAFGVQATPTLLLFKDGDEVGRSGGFIMPADLEEQMNNTSGH